MIMNRFAIAAFSALIVLSGACINPPQRASFVKADVEGTVATVPAQEKVPATLTCGAATDVDPGTSPLRRLTRDQYINSVSDLLGALPMLSTVLNTQAKASAFGNMPSDVSKTEVEGYQVAAESIAAAFIADAATFSARFACKTNTDQRGCVSQAFLAIATRAYRLPIEKKDLDAYLAIYDVGAKASYEHGVELMISTLLQAPRFLYQFEFGTNEKSGTNAVRLSSYELATRLAFTVWNTLPDDKLLKAAASGELNTAAGVKAQLKWMLADPKGSNLLPRFLEEWTQLGDLNAKAKNSELYPEWNDEVLKKALNQQASAFFQDVVNKQGATLLALLTSKVVMMNKDIAKVYGGTSADADFKGVEMKEGTTSGLLTLPAVLTLTASASESSPIYRGRFVRQNLLCQTLPPAPPNIPPAPKVTPGSSTRDRLQQHESDAACKGCHTMMDPIGFGFENFDAIGRFRTMDGGMPVDASGELTGARGIEGKFNGVVELGEKLAKSQDVQECMTRLWFRFMTARFEQGGDSCALRKAADAFTGANADFKVLPDEIVGTDAFLYRRPIKN